MMMSAKTWRPAATRYPLFFTYVRSRRRRRSRPRRRIVDELDRFVLEYGDLVVEHRDPLA